MAADPVQLRSLEHAVMHGDVVETVALLDAEPSLLNVRFPANLNLTPLMWACRNRRESIVAELLARGADMHSTNRSESGGDGGNTALWFTAQGPLPGTTGIAARLLAAGADLDRRCERGSTALWMAVDWAHLDLVQLLVAAGADSSVVIDGRTPLQMVEQNLAWCGTCPALTPDQQTFQKRGPRIAAFLRSLAT